MQPRIEPGKIRDLLGNSAVHNFEILSGEVCDRMPGAIERQSIYYPGIGTGRRRRRRVALAEGDQGARQQSGKASRHSLPV
jgi:hypothetical protein